VISVFGESGGLEECVAGAMADEDAALEPVGFGFSHN
jgi:hypothetical protein